MNAESANQLPGNTYQPPTTDTERRIAEIWSAVLGVPQVSVLDNFFDLGGHSVLLHMVQEKLGAEVSLVDLFSYPTVRGIAEYLDGRGSDNRDDTSDVGRRTRRDPGRLRRRRAGHRPTRQG